ncbi:CRISPR-associated endoribonuclease Cas6 [Roseivirga pacifica]|uniref:CRISPR-associated endoribonuclease Cas6 n=1 Tax=Roseivirga pacifica TaxID=1267423 RepID=UPI002094C71E|nr:CRISPR-associated endoribonuclease Cas6 [Roseivirga pacifica]MCO6360716.1 CRISPR-associated endoribonuclease Cas6 [Roseivirga pacifica]MCO6368605.1 CRISPR-associated endoribonuclease Cas6 [Roseivirga pacifica]MCO6372748.1 CRISPR-associated endoribonuclease Cas6 [Roseivirga pacifica]MCO6376806.1 CRISPR-associated endoribonuclease Cas6 [Roseivirga pacifica]MCO6377915.1 CRISPR-associated endoribonuclease Cas6 [Roseivirga pacifica]
MRVRIIFKLLNKGANLPFHHQHILAQYLKGVLLEGGESEYAEYSFFNFSALKGQTKVSRSGLHYYSNLVTLVVSSDSQGFIDYLLEQIFRFKKVDLGELQISPMYTEIEQTPEFADEMKFLCISPIVPIKASFNSQESKRFITPETDEFSDLLYESTLQRLEVTGNYSAEDFVRFKKFQLVPDEAYLQRLREKEKKFARIYSVYNQDVRYEVRGYTLPFKLYAAPEVQEFLFNCGLGNYTYKGFGMLDIANANPIERTERYRFKSADVEA